MGIIIQSDVNIMTMTSVESMPSYNGDAVILKVGFERTL